MGTARKTLLLAARDLVLLVFDMAFRTLQPCVRSTNDDIAIVRLDGLGDFVMWLDAFNALKDHHSSRRITLICNSAWSDLAERVPGFDEIIPIEVRRLRKDLAYRYHTFGELARRKFVTVINPLYTRQGFTDGEALVRILRADEKIGSSGDPSAGWRSRLGSYWFDKLLPASDEPLMEFQRNAEFLRVLGLSEYQAGLPQLSTDLFPHEDIPSESYYILFPGASDNIKSWSPACFAEIGRRIHEQTGMLGVVCGGPGDTKAAAEVVALSDVRMIDRSGRTSLTALAALIGRSELLVSNDTGAVHIAAALSIPSVCVVGGGHFGRFLPYLSERAEDRPSPRPVFHKMDCYGCNWLCIHEIEPGQPAPCVSSVSVARVFNEVQAILRDLEKRLGPHASPS